MQECQADEGNPGLELGAALGELALRGGRGGTAQQHFLAALALARSSMERQFLRQRIAACQGGAPHHARN